MPTARAEELSREPAAPARGARAAAYSILLVALLTALQLWRLCRASASVPLWDEAAHGFAGVQVAGAIRSLDPLALLLALNAQVVWPFVHSLMLAPAFLVMGDGLAAAEAVGIALYLATVMLLFAAGQHLHPRRGIWVGLLAASLALMAPSYGVFSTLAMLEIPGAFLLTLAFLLHLRAAGEPFSSGRLVAAGWATTALFLCKYNYGLLWLIPLAAWEWQRLPSEARARGRSALRARLRWSWWLRPMPLLFAIGGLAIAAILITGGGEVQWAGRRASFRSPGNLAYGLWLAALIWLLVPRRGRPSRLARLWRASPERARVLLQTVALPLAIWFTIPYPNRVRELLGFVANRDSGVRLWKPGALLFYPRAFAADYSPFPWVGWLVLALAIAMLFGRRDPALRLAAWAFLVGFVATAIHRYRDSRFLFTVCPMIWLCASGSLVRAASAGFDRLPRRWLAGSAWALTALGALAAAWFAGPTSFEILSRRAGYRSPASVVAVLDATLEALAPHPIAPDVVIASSGGGAPPAPGQGAAPSLPRRAVLLGYSNVVSPALLAWRAHLSRPEIPLAALPARNRGEAGESPERAGAWLETHADVVIAALAESAAARFGPEYRGEVKADRLALARLRGEIGRWSLISSTTVSGFRVERYDRVP